MRISIARVAVVAALLGSAGPAPAQRCRYPYYGIPNQPTMGGSPVNPLLGRVAPSLQMPGLDGKDHLLSEYRGLTNNRTIVLHFTDPRMPACQNAAKHLESLWKTVHIREVVFVAIVEGAGRDASPDALTFKHDNLLTFPILVDAEGKAAAEFFVRAYPTTIVINSGGKVSFVQSGGFNGGSIDAALKREERWR